LEGGNPGIRGDGNNGAFSRESWLTPGLLGVFVRVTLLLVRFIGRSEENHDSNRLGIDAGRGPLTCGKKEITTEYP
jgi:hypothetical protein